MMCLLHLFTTNPHSRVSLLISGVLYHPITKLNLFEPLDRIFKINNTWKGFDCDVKTLGHYLSRKLFPGRFIDRHIKQYLDSKMSVKKDSKEKPSEIRYIKLPYIGEFSGIAKNKIMKLFKQFCQSDCEIRIVFTLSKICDYFSTKDTLPDCFKSFVVYQFTCASCRTRYVGRTHKHFDTRITEHFGSESSSIFKHLNDSKNKACKSKTTRENAFKILDDAMTDYELALKE